MEQHWKGKCAHTNPDRWPVKWWKGASVWAMKYKDFELLIISPLDQNTTLVCQGTILCFFPSLKLLKFSIINCIYETTTHAIQCCNFLNSIIKILFSCLDQYERHGWLRLNTIPLLWLDGESHCFNVCVKPFIWADRSNVATPLMTRTNKLVLTDTVHTHFPMPLHWL